MTSLFYPLTFSFYNKGFNVIDIFKLFIIYKSIIKKYHKLYFLKKHRRNNLQNVDYIEKTMELLTVF